MYVKAPPPSRPGDQPESLPYPSSGGSFRREGAARRLATRAVLRRTGFRACHSSRARSSPRGNCLRSSRSWVGPAGPRGNFLYTVRMRVSGSGGRGSCRAALAEGSAGASPSRPTGHDQPDRVLEGLKQPPFAWIFPAFQEVFSEPLRQFPLQWTGHVRRTFVNPAASFSPRGSAMTVREVLKRLKQDGWKQVGMKGSHRQFKHPKKPGRVTVAGKMSKEIPPKTLASLLRQAGLKEDS